MANAESQIVGAINQMVAEISKSLGPFARDVQAAMASDGLTTPQAESILEYTVRHLAQIEVLSKSIERASELGAINDDFEEAATDAAISAHDLVVSLQTDIIDHIRTMGGNPNLLYSNLLKKYKIGSD